MKKQLICGLLCTILLLTVCSCRRSGDQAPEVKGGDTLPGQDPTGQIQEKWNETAPGIRTIEYSVMYLDRNTGLTSYDTASLEQTEPLEYSFILNKVLALSELPVSVRGIGEEAGGIYIDFDSTYFLSPENTEKNEASLLFSISYSMLHNFDGLEKIYFTLDGGDFITDYHAFSADTPFEAALLDQPMPDIHLVDYTISYYDVYTDSQCEYSGTRRYVKQMPLMFFAEELSRLMDMPLGVNSITQKEDRVIVDFASDKAPVSGAGSYEESCILDSLSAVLLQVLPSVNAVYITADGETYSSGHFVVEKDTPYVTRQHEKLG